MMPTDTVAIMMPKSMTFKPGPSAPYSPVTEETTAQTYVARNAQPSQALDFTVSGTGQMPRDTGAAARAGEGGAADASGQAGAAGSAASDTRPGGGLGVPLDPEGTNDPWAKYKWWILGGLGLAMAVGAGIMLKGGPAQAAAASGAGTFATGPVVTGSGSLLAAMKEELFALETDRLQGRLSESEYVEQKAALEVVLRRALLRGERSADASNVAGPVV
jgi:hypothetical protein